MILPQSEAVLFLQAKIARLTALLEERDKKIAGLERVLIQYRAEIRGRKGVAQTQED